MRAVQRYAHSVPGLRRQPATAARFPLPALRTTHARGRMVWPLLGVTATLRQNPGRVQLRISARQTLASLQVRPPVVTRSVLRTRSGGGGGRLPHRSDYPPSLAPHSSAGKGVQPGTRTRPPGGRRTQETHRYRLLPAHPAHGRPGQPALAGAGEKHSWRVPLHERSIGYRGSAGR